MLPINFIRQNKAQVLEGLQKRHFKHLDLVDTALALDDKRKQLQHTLDERLAEGKRLAADIGAMMKQGKHAEAETTKAQVAENKTIAKNTEEELSTVVADLETALRDLLSRPN